MILDLTMWGTVNQFKFEILFFHQISYALQMTKICGDCLFGNLKYFTIISHSKFRVPLQFNYVDLLYTKNCEHKVLTKQRLFAALEDFRSDTSLQQGAIKGIVYNVRWISTL